MNSRQFLRLCREVSPGILVRELVSWRKETRELLNVVSRIEAGGSLGTNMGSDITCSWAGQNH